MERHQHKERTRFFMNKPEFIAAVSDKAGLSRKDTERVINAALDTITAALVKGDKVAFSGFGIFESKLRKARMGRDPHTKEPMQIPETHVPSFKPSKVLKDTVRK